MRLANLRVVTLEAAIMSPTSCHCIDQDELLHVQQMQLPFPLTSPQILKFKKKLNYLYNAYDDCQNFVFSC